MRRINPYSLIKGFPLFFYTTASDSTLSIYIKGNSSFSLWMDWGDETIEELSITTSLVGFNHVYTYTESEPLYGFTLFGPLENIKEILTARDLRRTITTLQHFSNLEKLNFTNNNLIGTFPDIAHLSNLITLQVELGALDAIPDPAGLSNITIYRFQYNTVSGPFPNFSGCTALKEILLLGNSFSGPLNVTGLAALEDISVGGPSISAITGLSDCTNLTSLYCASENTFTYNSSTISLNCNNIFLSVLSESSVNQFLSDINDNLASRPVTGSIQIRGAAPTGSGLTYKANIQAHGWTVDTLPPL